MDNDLAGTGSMTAHFEDGHNGNPYRVASTNGSSVSETSNMPTAFTPQSVLQAQEPSQNGMSGGDYSNRMLAGGQMLPSMNGSSTGSYDQAKYMRFLGQLAV